MSAQLLTWIGGQHAFRLGLGELRALQEACDAGPLAILARLKDGTWRVDDMLDTLRLGLIGGGMADRDAARLITDMAQRHGLVQFALPAQAVLVAALMGPVNDDADADAQDDAQDDAGPGDAPGKPAGADSGISTASGAPAP